MTNKLKIEAGLRLASLEIEAEHDTTKNTELNKLYRNLLRGDVEVDISQKPEGWQIYKDDPTKDDIEELVTKVKKFYALRVEPGVLNKENFALTSPDGLTLQKIGSTIRVFFSK